MSLRSVAETLSHRLVVRRHLPSPFHDLRIYASTEGGLRYLAPSLAGVDDAVLETVARYVSPGHHVWDIGSNLGLFSIPAASRAGPNGSVVAIDADPWLIRLLDKSSRRNQGIAPITTVCVAAGRRPGVAHFNIARRSRSTSFLEGFGTTQTGGIRHTLTVPMLDLDTLGQHFQYPDILKIDVEGAEVDVLSGACAVLATKPIIFVEVASASRQAVDDLLRPLGYRYLNADDGYNEVSTPVGQTVAVTESHACRPSHL